MSNTTQTAKMVDLVTRVHGENHPHLTEVKSLFHEINSHYPHLKEIAAPEHVELKGKLAQIRELSNDFQSPADGCEGYQMMDQGLARFEEDVLAQLG